jgi:hypothetical protein
MSGAELGTPEFAYLLAAVQAEDVLGIDTRELFPKAVKTRDKLYAQGRSDLETNGWLKPIESATGGEYDLNAELFHLVAAIASPNFVLASLREHPSEASGFTLHYLTEDGIAELAPVAGGRFRLGVVPDRKALGRHMAELLGLKNTKPAVQGSLPSAAFKKVVAAAKKGQTEKAEELLSEAGVDGKQAASLLGAAGEPASGQIVMLPGNGRPEDGRRAAVLGQDKAAWLVFEDESDSSSIVFVNGCEDRLEAIVTQWTEESLE